MEPTFPVMRSRGSRGRSCEGEDTEVIQIADEHVVFEGDLTSKAQPVQAFRCAHDISHRIEVGITYGSGEGSSRGENCETVSISSRNCCGLGEDPRAGSSAWRIVGA